MRRKTVLAVIAAMTVSISGIALAGEIPVYAAQNSETEVTDSEERSLGKTGCETGEHQWSEWKVTIPADCMKQGQQTRKCEVCGMEETASIDKTEEHDLKEISHQEATEEKAGFILYACKRNGCEYQKKEEIPVKEAADSENTEESQRQEEDSEKENTSNLEEENENTDGADTDGNTTSDKGLSGETDKTSTESNVEKEKTEILPDEDTEESASFAYATSSEVVAEYDPTTAVGTRKIVKDPADPGSAEEVEGMTVPEGVIKVQRDSEGNITDLAVSTSVEEIRNGFSFSSKSKALHSISIINEKDSTENWITLTAEKSVSELGIHIKQTSDGMAVTLTENKKPVQIVKADSDETKITLGTSTGGNCEISRHIQKFELKEKNRGFKYIDEILFHDMSSQKPSVELTTVKEFGSGKDTKTKSEEEKLYWLQQYDDESQDPIVITIYG